MTFFDKLGDNLNITARVPGGIHHDGPGILISTHYFIPHGFATAEALARANARFHPRRIMYRGPATSRAVAMALERPGHVVNGLGALALFGLDYFADACDTTLYGDVRRVDHATRTTPLIQKNPGLPTWNAYYYDAAFLVAPPAHAVVDALKLLRRGVHAWQVSAVPGMCAKDIRAVQLIDATRRFLHLTPTHILEAARKRVDQRWLARICRLSSALADSPRETEMRLIALAVCQGYGLELTEQVPLMDGSRIVTTFDLAIVALMIGIMYDGEHHLQREQRDKDSRINTEAALMGWVVIRITSGTLHLLGRFIEAAIAARMGASVG